MALSNLFGWEKEKDTPATACGASDKPAEAPVACGASDAPATACGAADETEEKPAACGSACGAGDKK